MVLNIKVPYKMWKDNLNIYKDLEIYIRDDITFYISNNKILGKPVKYAKLSSKLYFL